MQDGFNRNIDYLRLSVTDLCNYRCIYCMDSNGIRKKKHDDILSIEELISVGHAAVRCGIKKIRITGGEPLVRKGIIDLCRGLRKIDGLEELVLTTNGALLKDMAGELRSAGVDRINISLDTLREDRFKEITRIGQLKDVMAGMDAAVNAGFANIKLNVVLMGGINDDEIVDFVELTRDRSISVRFIELMPMGPCKAWDSRRFVSSDAVLKCVPELMPMGRDGVASLYCLKDARGSVGIISPISHLFCNECNRIRVTADGRILPCLHSDMEYEIKGLSETEMSDVIKLAISNKPGRHKITETHVSKSKDFMNEIGG